MRRVMVGSMLAVAVLAPVAGAQGTGVSHRIETSIRSSGLGGAAAALWWDGASSWTNPALLGYSRGIRWEWARTELVPDLPSDVSFTSKHLVVGGGGIGFGVAQDPVGEMKLDYGESEGFDSSGNSTGTFSSFEITEGWGFGVSLGRFADGIAHVGGAGPVRLPVDVAFGMNFKEYELQLVPDSTGRAESHPQDIGWLVRATPVGGADGTLRLDVAYGGSIVNADDETIVLLGADEAIGMVRIRRHGLAARLELPFDVAPGPGLVGAFVTPRLALGAAFDLASYAEGASAVAYRTRQFGVEAEALGVFALRLGYLDDPDSDRTDVTFGAGVNLDYRGLVGVRYDFASFPQADGLDRLARHGVGVWADPIAIVQAARH